MPVLAIADLFGISGRRDELLAALARAEREAVAQPGCVRYAFAATISDPDRFVIPERLDFTHSLARPACMIPSTQRSSSIRTTISSTPALARRLKAKPMFSRSPVRRIFRRDWLRRA